MIPHQDDNTWSLFALAAAEIRKQRSATERQRQANQLVAKIGAVLADAPHLVQRHLQRLEYPGRADEQHDERKDLDAVVRCQPLHAADDEILIAGQEILCQLNHGSVQSHVVQYLAGDGQEKHHGREKRQDGVGCDGEGVGMHFRVARYFNVGITCVFNALNIRGEVF